MKIYLAGTSAYEDVPIQESKYVLESFYYFKDWQKKLINKDFMLDSGAFTFMNSARNKSDIDFDNYVEKYAEFINQNGIELFFEMDIDCVVGIKEVERLRQKLEKITSKKCIPVWHKSRGLDYFKQLAQNYKYISIGGIVINEILKSEYKYFPELINIAHQNKCKIHALGFLGKDKAKYDFDSVDGTNWTLGNRFGVYFKFINRKIYRQEFKDKRAVNLKELNLHNFNEWCKYQKYMDK